MKEKVPIQLVVAEMKNIGKREQEYDSEKYKSYASGPDYVRVIARSDGSSSLLRLDIPASWAKRFKIGATLSIA